MRSMALRPILLVLLLTTCSSRLPHPSYTGQPTSALAEVDYPPPPARVVFVPDQPRADAVWINGEWHWQGRRWAWKAGGWFVPPPGAAYARPVMVRRSDGKLFFAAGAWRMPNGEEVPAPEPQKTASSTAGAVVNSEGDTEPTAADVHLDGGARDAETD